MKLKKIALKDKPVFERYLKRATHGLSVYSFENIYPWRGLFSIRWGLARNCLCVFFQDRISCFLYLPPLGSNIDPRVLEDAFKVMDAYNANKDISRIENIEASQRAVFEKLGLCCRGKPPEYVYARNEMAGLRGNKFKHKRACVNYFLAHYTYVYAPLARKDRQACLALYAQWMSCRKAQSQDPIYKGMLDDGYTTLKEIFRSWGKLGIGGRVVKIGGEAKAFTFGYPLNKEVFCIFYEVADLEIKGLSQFIFQRFCAELTHYRF